MKRFAVILGSLVVGIVGTAAAIFFGLGYYLSPQSQLVKADAIVAISGGDTDARTDEAVKLYHDGWSQHIIFSGAALDPNSPSNAQAMATRARHQGVPNSAIALDEAATNTRENAADVAQIVQTHSYQSIILVTSPYHQRRADIVFEQALGKGVAIINHSTVDQAWRRSHWWATSYSRSLTLSELQKVIYELLNNPANSQ
jgi:uncharacterized SAM-binding protein YcdF (DUF218 family)